MGKPNSKKLCENKINELISSTTDPKIIKNLEYLNDKVLIEHDNLYTNEKSHIAENAGISNNIEHSKLAQKEIEKYPEYKNSISIELDLIKKNDDTVVENSKKEFKEKITSEKITLNDKTKKILKEAFSIIDTLKDLDGNPLISSEVPKDGSVFKTISETQAKILELVQGKDASSNLSEISKLTDKYKKDLKTMDKLLDVVSELDADNFVANSSVSRYPYLEEKYIDNYKGTSQANSLFILLSYIKTTGSTVDEFLENPIDIANKHYDKFKDFKDVNEYGKKVGDLAFIEGMAGQSSDKKLKEIKSKFIKQSGPMLRFTLAASMLQNENAAHNRMVADLYNAHIVGNAALNRGKFFDGYFKDNQILTVKNILINTDKDKDYASLTTSSEKVTDAYTGNEKVFDYNAYLESGKIDTKKLVEKFAEVEKNANKYPITGNVAKNAIKEISKDILKTKVYENSNEFNKIMETAGMSYKDVINLRRGSKTLKNYIRDEYNDIHKDGFNKEKIQESLHLIKAMNENYKSRSWFGRHLWGRGEGKLVDSIRENLVQNGLSEKNISDFLDGNIDINDVAKNEINNEKISKESREHIEVNELNDNKTYKNVEKEKANDLQKDLHLDDNLEIE